MDHEADRRVTPGEAAVHPVAPVIDRKAVHSALKAWHYPQKMGAHALARLRLVATQHSAARHPDTLIGYGLALREVLRATIETLKPEGDTPDLGDPAWRHYLLLERRYVYGRPLVEVAEQLGLAQSTFQHEQALAMDLLAHALLARERTVAPAAAGAAPAAPPVAAPANAGHLGKYQLLRRRGEGAMAEVYEALQPGLDRRVALKLLHAHLARDAEFLARFEREAAAVARLRHPNIVQVFDYDVAPGRDGPVPYIVMEYIDGPTLADEIERLNEQGDRMALEETLRVVEALAAALDYAHARGMVHHDVKPANIMFTAEGQVVLADFGLAHLRESKAPTDAGSVSGTAEYMAPEQARGQRGNRRSDVYALGVVLYELVTGSVPFAGDTAMAVILQHLNAAPPPPRTINPKVPAAVEQVILKAMAKAPDERQQTAGELAQDLRAALGQGEAAARPHRAEGPAPACPYRGLFAFREADAPYFFGREAFTERLVAAVEGKGEPEAGSGEPGPGSLLPAPALVAVIGPSGSGKSSVVYAGLLPMLRQATELREAQGQGWLIADLRPGARPFHALAAALLPLMDDALSETDRLTEIHKLARALDEGTFGLDVVIGRILEKHPHAARVLLVIDQFEELYTLCPEPETRRRFIDLCLDQFSAPRTAHSARSRTLLLTLRADFMGQALVHRGLADALQDAALILGPMTRAELQRAIENPAARQGYVFEAGLVERLLADVGDEPGNLPLLEFALTALWERPTDGLLTHEAYTRIGLVEGALARYADEVFARLSMAEQEQARRIYVQMVRPGEGTEDTRRQATRAELDEAAWPLVRRLADARLVVTDRDEAGIETAEVVHEALLRSWARLREWMGVDRRFRAWQERLRAGLRQWESTGRDQGSLLRGTTLAEAEGWLGERAGEISAAECAFVQAGVALREHETAEAEAQRQRELEAAQRLAEEQAHAAQAERQRAEVEQKRAEEQAQSAGELRRRARGLALALGAAALLALAAIYLSFQFNDASQRNAGLAQQNAAVAATAQAANTAEVAQRAAAQAANTVAVAQRATAQAAEAVAVAQQATAQANFIRADAQRLAVEASNLLQTEGDADLIALLSLHSLNLQYTPQGDGALAGAAQLKYPVRVFRAYGGGEHDVYLNFSPDGKSILVRNADDAKLVQLLDVQSGQEVHRFVLPDTAFLSPRAFSPDGRYAVLGCADNTVRLWEVQTGQVAYQLAGYQWGMFSPDRKYLFIAPAALPSSDTTVALLDLQTRQIKHTLSLPPYNRLDLSPDNRYVIAVLVGDNLARLYDIESAQEVRTFEHTQMPLEGAFSADGRYLLVGTLDASAWLWDVATGQLVRRFTGHRSTIRAVAFSSDGKSILTSGEDNTARLWDVQTGVPLRIFTGLAGIWKVTFSPDGRYALTGSFDNTVKLWDLQASPYLPQFVGHTGGVEVVAYSPDGQYVATAGFDTTARLWEAHTGRQVQVFAGHTGPINMGLAFSPDGKYLLTSGYDGTARLWDVGTGQAIRVLTTLNLSTDGADFSPDGRTMITAAPFGFVQLWDVQTGQELRRFTGPEAGPLTALFSPDGQYVLAGCGSSGAAYLWDVNTGREVRVFESPGWILYASFSPDGRSVATSNISRNLIQLWDVQTGEELRRIPATGPALTDFSPDGRTLLAGLGDKTARIWDLQTGQEVRRFMGHSAAVYAAAFSPDGKYVLTGSDDMTARLWDADYHTTMDYLCSVLTRDFTDEERTKYNITDTQPTCPKP